MIECIDNQKTQKNPQLDGKCLHIGCGLISPHNWENIDVSPSLRIAKIPLVGKSLQSLVSDVPWPQAVKYGDIVKGLNIKPDRYSLIFAAHVLEHLSLSDFHLAMKNIYTYLKPGGVFRTIVPDLEQYALNYLENRSNDSISALAAHEFMKNSFLGYSEQRSGFFQRFRHAFSNSKHQWMWDEPSLAEAFRNHGFKQVRRCYYGDWQDTRFADVEKEAHYKRKDSQMKGICIEGYK